MPGQLPPAFVSRLLAHLRTCDQPLIEIWGWPWSGKRRLFEALAAADPAAWSRFGPHVPLRRVSRGPRWLVAEGVHRAHELLVAAEALRPDQRLIFLLERRCDEEILPARSLTPTELLLREDEMAEMFGPAGSREVEELMAHSDGWLGPLEWLRGRTGCEFSEITFIDDKVNHLDSVASLGVRCALAAWGYNGAREIELARLRGYLVCTLADVEAQLFDG